MLTIVRLYANIVTTLSEVYMEQQFLSSNEFKEVLGIHRNTVINWIRSGKIKSTNINGHYYIPISEVERLKGEGEK